MHQHNGNSPSLSEEQRARQISARHPVPRDWRAGDQDRHRPIDRPNLAAESFRFYRPIQQRHGVLQEDAARRPRPRGIVDAFGKMCQHWSLTQDQIATLLGLGDDAPYLRSIMSGEYLPVGRDTTDRMTHVIGIGVGLGELLGDDRDAEVAWLNTPRTELNGIAPLVFMLIGSMRNILLISDLVLRLRGLT